MAKTKSSSTTTWDEHVIRSLIPWRTEMVGLGLVLVGIITILGLLGVTTSTWLQIWVGWWRTLLGLGSYLLGVSFVVAGAHLLLRRVERPYRLAPLQVVGLELILLTTLPLAHQLSGATRTSAYEGAGGGLVGWALAEPLLDFLGPFLSGLFYLILLAWGVALIARVSRRDAAEWLAGISVELRQWAGELEAGAPPLPEPVTSVETAVEPVTRIAPPRLRRREPDELIIVDDSAPDAGQGGMRRSRRLPRLAALDEGTEVELSKAEIDAKSQIIEQTLADFGLPATVTEIRRGPAVTQFGVLPGYIEKPGPDGTVKQQKVRISQIAALQKDLTLALAVPRLRIQAPVPGRGIVGVEVPNAEINVVRLQSIVTSGSYRKMRGPLKVALGRDVSGAPVSIDLSKMPHLLIAGTTGSGKSVCINSLVTSLVFNNTPEQLKLVMVDPKKVELIRFNGLPHLIGSVETEAERAIGVLRWLTVEMDMRYQSFAEVGAKQLSDYNRKIKQYLDVKPYPHLCVFIDELADLMMMYPGDTERTLCRLAQMARATGIHLVVATQRPSTDVITGLIKANFPARIAFAVASGIDSRVILDTVGAEQLLGKGDMLFMAPDASSPARIQGVFVGDNEIERVVTHWQTSEGTAVEPAPWENLIARQALLDETDELLEQAIELAQKYETLSTSLIQRRLRLGYPRAARLMEHLYEMGLVEDPKRGGKTRKTYVSEEDSPLDDLVGGDG